MSAHYSNQCSINIEEISRLIDIEYEFKLPTHLSLLKLPVPFICGYKMMVLNEIFYNDCHDGPSVYEL